MQQAAGREALAQAADQLVGEAALGRPDGGDVPFRRLEVVDRDEGRLAAHGQAHVLRCEIGIDLFAEPVEPRPGLVGERLVMRGASASRVTLISKPKSTLAARPAGDRRGGAVMRRGRERECAPRRSAGRRWRRSPIQPAPGR